MKLASLFTEQRRQAAKRTMKGSAAFTSALLFGTNESQGLLRTLGQASLEAGGKILAAKTGTDSQDEEEFGYSWSKEGYREGPEGYGFYSGGQKIHD